MDYQMYKIKDSAELLKITKKKDYKALGKHIYDADIKMAPREYVMGVISKKEPKKIYKIIWQTDRLLLINETFKNDD